MNYFMFGIVDELGESIDDSLTVTIYASGGAATTIYSDQNKTAKDNPITVTNGQVKFWAGDYYIDVKLYDGTNTIKKTGLGQSNHRVMFPQREYEFTTALVSGTLTTTGNATFGSTGSGVDSKFWGVTAGDYALFDASGDVLVLEDYDIQLNQGSQIKFIDVTDGLTDWTIDNSTDETLLFLPTETDDTQTFNIGNATKTSDFRLFGATASTVTYDASADLVIYDAYNVRHNDDDTVGFGDASEGTIGYDEAGKDDLQLSGVNLRLDQVDLVFEGTTDDALETTLTVEDPTVDRTVTLPDYTGAVPLVIAQGSTQSTANNTTADVTGSSLTLADGWFTAGKTLRWTLAGTVTGDNDRITVILYIDDAAISTITSTDAAGAAGDWKATFILHEHTDAANQDVMGELHCAGDTDADATAIAYDTDTTDFNDGGTTVVKCQIETENAGDTITCEYVMVEHWVK